MTTLTLYTPAGVLLRAAGLKLAAKRLAALGFDVAIDEAARARHQRFGGDDDTRLAALHRVAPSASAATTTPGWRPCTAWRAPRRRWRWPPAAATA